MKTRGIPVNDLFGFIEPLLPQTQLPKNVHFNRAGSKALAGEVAAAIGRELDTPGDDVRPDGGQ